MEEEIEKVSGIGTVTEAAEKAADGVEPPSAAAKK